MTAQIIRLVDSPQGKTQAAGVIPGDESADLIVIRQEVCGLPRKFSTSCASYSKAYTGETSHEGYTVYKQDKSWRDIE